MTSDVFVLHGLELLSMKGLQFKIVFTKYFTFLPCAYPIGNFTTVYVVKESPSETLEHGISGNVNSQDVNQGRVFYN